MTTTQPTRTACPSWCDHHPANGPEAHQGAHWNGYGLTVGIEQDNDGAVVQVDHNAGEYMQLTEAQAHELGMQLVRTADRLRRARQEPVPA